MDKGFFYVLTNPAQAGLILVDTSSRHPEERLLDDDLSGPGIPVPYELRYFALLEDCNDAMESVHEALEDRYIDKRFYEADPEDAVAALEHSGVEILYRESSIGESLPNKTSSGKGEPVRERRTWEARDTDSDDGRLSPGRAGGRYRGRDEGPSRRNAPVAYRTSLEERQQRKQAALRRMASNNGIRVAEQNRGVQAPEATPDTDFEFDETATDTAPAPTRQTNVEAPGKVESPKVERARREPMLTTVVDNTPGNAANDAPLINDAVDDDVVDDGNVDDAGAPKPGLRKLFGLGGGTATAEATKSAPHPVRLEPTVPVPAVAAEKRADTISARNEGSAAKAVEPEMAEIVQPEPVVEPEPVEKKAEKEVSRKIDKKQDKKKRQQAKKKEKQEAAARKAQAQSAEEHKEAKPEAKATVSPPPKAKRDVDGAMPIPSLDLSAKPKKAPKPSDKAQQSTELPQPSPQPHGIVYGPQGPIALHPVPGTPYMAMSPIQTAPGGMMPGGPMGNAPIPAPVVHNVGAPHVQPSPAAGRAPDQAPRAAVAPGPMPGVTQSAPGAMPDADNPHHVEAWLNAQDRDSAKRASNRRAILFSLIGIPLGLVTGGGYVVYQGLTDEKTIAIAVGGAVIASIISLYIVGRLTDNPDNDSHPAG